MAPLSVVVSIGVIALLDAGADALAWIALVLVPPACALAFGWAAHGARPRLAVLALPALVAAVAAPDDPLGRVGRLVLIAGSVVTVGRLLAGAAPLTLLKAGVVAMAGIDAVVIFGDLFDRENALFDAAAPAPGLPRLQVAELGDTSTDYGDFFAAGVLGGVLAAEGRAQLAAAAGVLAASVAWDQLFRFYDVMPATVPVAFVLVVIELRDVWRGRRTPRTARGAPRPPARSLGRGAP